ncbi:MAG TPA: DUF4232 domain-containing protein [Gaiellaceae bacterium]|jgi:hypothetical protein
MDTITPPKPPAPDELEALIREARARQLHRRLVGAASIAVAAALALGLYAIFGGFRHWGSGGSRRGGAPPACRSSQLSTSAGFQAAAGTTFDPVLMTNRSSQTCTLGGGVPKAQILFRGGPFSIRAIPWTRGLSAFGTPAGPVLAPGAKDVAELAWRDFCPRPAAAPQSGSVTFVLRFPHGPRVTARQSSPDVPGPALPGCAEVTRPAVAVSPLLRYP